MTEPHSVDSLVRRFQRLVIEDLRGPRTLEDPRTLSDGPPLPELSPAARAAFEELTDHAAESRTGEPDWTRIQRGVAEAGAAVASALPHQHRPSRSDALAREAYAAVRASQWIARLAPAGRGPQPDDLLSASTTGDAAIVRAIAGRIATSTGRGEDAVLRQMVTGEQGAAMEAAEMLRTSVPDLAELEEEFVELPANQQSAITRSMATTIDDSLGPDKLSTVFGADGLLRVLDDDDRGADAVDRAAAVGRQEIALRRDRGLPIGTRASSLREQVERVREAVERLTGSRVPLTRIKTMRGAQYATAHGTDGTLFLDEQLCEEALRPVLAEPAQSAETSTGPNGQHRQLAGDQELPALKAMQSLATTLCDMAAKDADIDRDSVPSPSETPGHVNFAHGVVQATIEDHLSRLCGESLTAQDADQLGKHLPPVVDTGMAWATRAFGLQIDDTMGQEPLTMGSYDNSYEYESPRILPQLAGQHPRSMAQAAAQAMVGESGLPPAQHAAVVGTVEKAITDRYAELPAILQSFPESGSQSVVAFGMQNFGHEMGRDVGDLAQTLVSEQRESPSTPGVDSMRAALLGQAPLSSVSSQAVGADNGPTVDPSAAATRPSRAENPGRAV